MCKRRGIGEIYGDRLGSGSRLNLESGAAQVILLRDSVPGPQMKYESTAILGAEINNDNHDVPFVSDRRLLFKIPCGGHTRDQINCQRVAPRGGTAMAYGFWKQNPGR